MDNNGGATASDDCSDVTITSNVGPLSDECGATGTLTVTFTATDDCGNTAQTTATFTIEDTTAPVLTDANDMLVECDGAGNVADLDAWLANNGGATASDDCSDVVWTNDAGPLSDECGATGSVTVTFTATDDCGNTAQTTATFTIEDTTAPVVTDASDMLVECDGAGNVADLDAWLANNGGATASDDCSDVVWTNDAGPLSDECGATGSVTVTFTATDDCGNTAQTTATFTIEDTTAPVVTDANDMIVECDGAGNTADLQAWLANNGGATATDDCSDVVWTSDQGDLTDECGATGSLTVTFTATDDCGNTAQVSATFTIEDTTAPEITDAADLTVECDGQGNVADLQAWLENNGGATASDDCSDVIITNNFTNLSDECGMTGAALVTFTATDECGNTSTTQAIFTIEDTTSPMLDNIPADEEVECDEIPGVVMPTVTDACDPNVNLTLSEDTEPGDCPNSYTIVRTFIATDACGNSSSATQRISVGDATAPILSGIPSDETVECNEIPEVPMGSVTATDNCDDDVSLTFEEVIEPSAICEESFVIRRIWTATDNCGNASSEEQVIEVGDSTPPVLAGIPADDTAECDDIPPAATIGQITASDNCDPDVDITFEETITDGDCADNYTIIRTWTATDNCGNAASATQTIEVGDTEAPVLSGIPANTEIECDEVDDIPDANVTATDNCDDDVDITVDERIEAGDCEGAYTIIRTYTATDNCGNAASAEQIIEVGDNTAPTIAGIPGNMEVECDDIPANNAIVTATDNCDPEPTIEFTETTEPGACAGSYIIVRTWTATDDCGNQDSGEQRITVGDTTAPTLVGVPADAEYECDAIPANDADVTATDNCDANPVITFSEVTEQGVCAGSFVIVRTWTATDECGNASTAEQRITVGDTTAPTLVGVPANAEYECDAIPANDANVTATDNCDANPVITFSEITEQGVCAGSFVIVRTWTATDDCGNASSAEQRITVGDTTAPTLLGVPANDTVECDAIPAAANGVTATDNCDANPNITFDETIEPGTCAGSYTIVRIWTATDDCGNAATEEQRITVGDNTAPELSGVPANAEYECDAVPANNATVTATDNCDDNPVVSFEETTEAGDCAGSFVIVRTWTATDACGNETSESQRINVGDNTAPALVGIPADDTIECDEDFDQNPAVTATDNCDDNPSIEMTSITEPGACEGSYTLIRTWTATDACGNQSSESQRITVGDNTAPELVGVPQDAQFECDAIPGNNANVTATDNCDDNPVVSFNETTEAGDCAGAYVIVRTWTATDDCGNESSATQRITVGDNTAPILSGIPDDASFECDEVPSVDPAGVTATDNCDPNVTVSFDEIRTDGDCAGSYVMVRTWTATDDCGNESSASQTITVGDTTAPTISGTPGDMTLSCDQLPPAAGTVTATDNCDDNPSISFEETIQDGDCNSSTLIIRTWTATDACGNESSTSQTITITGDESAPVLVGVPADRQLDCDEAANLPVPNVTATDDCDASVDVDFVETIEEGNCDGNFVIVRTWTATDDCGNQTSETQRMSVGDNDAPVFTNVPQDESVDCGADLPAAANVTAEDNCSDVTISFDEIIPDANNCQSTYTVIRTWTATDACGNAASVSQNITVNGDNTPPTLVGVPADDTVGCDAPNVPTPNVTATDNCDNDVDVSMTETTEPGICPNNFTIVRTWTATDDCGNIATATQRISVGDNGAPQLQDVPADLALDCGDVVPVPPTLIATDDCDDNVNVVFSQTDGGNADCQDSYTIVRTWVAIDACGNSSSASQTITVTGDNTAPVLAGIPEDRAYPCGSVPDLPQGTVTATDDCDNEVSITMSEREEAGDCPQSFTIIRTWTATDACGNSSSASQRISIGDNNAPVLTGVPADAAIDCGENPPAAPNVIATDDCDNDVDVVLTEQEIGTAGDCQASFSIVRTWTATDACGNVATATQTITVSGDATAPMLSGVPENLNLDCTQATNIPEANVTASDDCDPDVAINMEEVTTPGDCEGAYTIVRTWTATDNCGNTATATQTINVNDSTPPVLSGVPADQNLGCNDDINIGAAAVTASDDCDSNVSVEMTEERIDGPCPGSYTLIRTWTATDDCGNAVSDSQTINVGDAGAPVFSNVPADVTIDCDDNVNLPEPTATDDCSDVTIDFNEEIIEQACAHGYVARRTWTATDDCGNSAQVSQLVTVQDNVAPICNDVPADITIYLQQGELVPAVPTVTGSDNCDDNPTVTFNETRTDGCEYTITRTWTITDDCGNATTCSQEIFVDGGVGVWVEFTADENCDEMNGIAVLAPSNFDFQWSDGGTGSVREDLADGVYMVTVTDPITGCDAVVIVEIFEIGNCNECVEPGINNVIINNASCGNADGNVQISIDGNPADYSYTWIPNVGNSTGDGNIRTDLPGGMYEVIISDPDFADCFAKVNFVISNADGPEVSDIQVTNATCGLSNGTVTLNPAGYQYMWIDDNFVGAFRDDLAPGLYEIAVMDPERPDCPSIIMIEVLGESDLSATVDILTQPNCGQSNGAVAINANGANLTYAWSDGGTGSNRDNLPSGAYAVTISDDSGCEDLVMFTLMDNVSGAVVNVQDVLTICVGELLTVDFTVDLSDGFAGPASEVIIDQNGNTINNGGLSGGSYCIIIEDANGCVAGEACFVVNELPMIQTAVTATNANCNLDGTIDLMVAGGLAPFAYAWSDGNTDQNRADLSIGTYSVTITDANGCQMIENNIIIETDCNDPNPCLLEATATIVTLPCDDTLGEVSLDATGANGLVTYAWSDGGAGDFRNDLVAGDYIITVTDADACEYIIELTIAEDPNCGAHTGCGIEISAEIISQPTCDNADGEVALTVLAGDNGNLTYLWSDGAAGATRNDLPEGTISVVVFDGTGCDFSIEITLTDDEDCGTDPDPCAGTYTELEAECVDGLGYACIDVPHSDFNDFTVRLANGDLYEGVILACNPMNFSRYDYSVLLGEGNKGPYVLESWFVNGELFTGEFNDVAELVDFMNQVDPTGNWVLDTETLRIIGGDANNTYGDMSIDQLAALDSHVTLGLSSGTVHNGTAIGPFAEGENEILIFAPGSDCPDTLVISVDCDDIPNAIEQDTTVETGVEMPIEICVDLTALNGAAVDSVELCGAPDGGSYELLADGCLIYTPGPGLAAGDTDQLCITVCDADGNCVETTVTINIVDDVITPPVDPSADTVEITIVLGTDSLYCLDTTELTGDIVSVVNGCADDASGAVDFALDGECLIITGELLGDDIACVVYCDADGNCDTTIVLVTVIPEDVNMVPPVAIDDDSMTVVNTGINAFGILLNDMINGETVNVEIITDPSNGTVTLNADNTVDYMPDNNFCGDDTFTYVITTPAGSDTAVVNISILCEAITIFNGFSPNNDGVNDTFRIMGIESFPNNEVIIFNRWGNQVYYKRGYTNAEGFDGTWETSVLPDGTYFYVIDDGEGNKFSGYLQIHR